jgi:oxygen-independent coproporphyrinogen-3 oxidase
MNAASLHPLQFNQTPDAANDTALMIDAELLRRFGGRGPRYTSYPTADRFHEGCGAKAYSRALSDRGSRSGDPLGLYIHIPFCRTICYYCGCNKIGTKRTEQAQPYLDALIHEIDLVSSIIGKRQRVSHLHFGGGTPTFMPDELLGRLLSHLRNRFDLAEHGEYSIEVDPRTVDAPRMERLLALGLNRVSLGVQDFDPEVQKAVNRIQPYELTEALVRAARKAGFLSVNVDLIYGLPRQTIATFAETVARTVALRPDRVALYHYAHLPKMFKPQRRIDEEALPAPSEKAVMFENAVRGFEAAGYHHLGLDHFALEHDELAVAQREGRLHRNFQGYCSHDEGDLIALGVSAISSVGGVYAQNDKTLSGWLEALSQHRLPTVRGMELDPDDHIRRDIIQDLMCTFAIDRQRLDDRYGHAGTAIFDATRPALSELHQAGVIHLEADGLKVEPAGRLLVRAVAMAFDSHLQREAAIERYSSIA